jgi:hypothetical protein
MQTGRDRKSEECENACRGAIGRSQRAQDEEYARHSDERGLRQRQAKNLLQRLIDGHRRLLLNCLLTDSTFRFVADLRNRVVRDITSITGWTINQQKAKDCNGAIARS